MHREIISSADGSHTVFIPELNEHYHSVHGALNESLHVFIEAGFNQLLNYPEINILEIGFGTGLNVLLTAIEAGKMNKRVIYTSLEPFPLSKEIISNLNYTEVVKDHSAGFVFEKIHFSPWNSPVIIHPNFILEKREEAIQEVSFQNKFNLVYYDAFAPRVQPELWTQDIFENIFNLLETGGILVTYCAKGAVKRALAGAGFKVESLPGPPGKREMTRAIKV
jgi:tRNA U34 5-methylaminomethyl-2-thiouridine-forming methyltransferase MnmC